MATNPMVAYGVDACLDSTHTASHVCAFWWFTAIDYVADHGWQPSPHSVARVNSLPPMHWAACAEDAR